MYMLYMDVSVVMQYLTCTCIDADGCIIAKSNVADSWLSQGLKDSREEVLHWDTRHCILLLGENEPEYHLKQNSDFINMYMTPNPLPPPQKNKTTTAQQKQLMTDDLYLTKHVSGHQKFMYTYISDTSIRLNTLPIKVTHWI